MKKLIGMLILGSLVVACSPKIGSEEWCTALKEKPAADWTSSEAKDYTKHCVF